MNAEKPKGLTGKLIGFGMKLLPYVQYVLWASVRKQLGRKTRSVLDIGCCQGIAAGNGLRGMKVYSVGLEAFLPDLRIAKRNHTHHEFIWGDARALPFQDDSFDAVVCIEMLEHVSKEEGISLLRDIERIARNKVVVSTPASFLETSLDERGNPHDEGNPFQEHLSGWRAEELSEQGYRVYHSRFLYKVEEWLNNRHQRWAWFLNIILFSLIGHTNFITPRFSSHLFCVKEIGD